MLNGKDMMIHLIVGLIKKDIIGWINKKSVNTFLNHINLLAETLMSRLIYLITQQKQI